jgi:hypothetical protein
MANPIKATLRERKREASTGGGMRTIPLTPAALQADDVGADTTANAVEDEVQQDERERLLGPKEGEVVGKILDADRRMGQIAAHSTSVLGVSVFVNNHEDAEHGKDARPNWESATDKTITLEMLSEAIEQKGAREYSPFLPSC